MKELCPHYLLVSVSLFILHEFVVHFAAGKILLKTNFFISRLQKILKTLMSNAETSLKVTKWKKNIYARRN